MIVCMGLEDTIRVMELAYDIGMITPEYAYFNFRPAPDADTEMPWGNLQGLDTEAAKKRKTAFSHMKTVKCSRRHKISITA